MNRRFLIGIILLAFTGFGCGISNVTITPTPIFPTRAVLPSSATPPATIPAAPIPTSTLAPQAQAPTRTPRPVATLAPPPAQQGMINLNIYLVAVGDNGASGKKIGCDDSIVPVVIQVPYTQGVLRASLNKLLSIKDRDYGQSGLVNALYQSDLSIDSLAIQDGEAVIRLTGSLKSGGTCDDPRIIAQIEETALQFSTVTRVSIFVNGVKIQQLLSGRG